MPWPTAWSGFDGSQRLEPCQANAQINPLQKNERHWLGQIYDSLGHTCQCQGKYLADHLSIVSWKAPAQEIQAISQESKHQVREIVGTWSSEPWQES